MNKSISIKNKSGRKAAYGIRAGLVLVAWLAFALISSQRTIVVANAFRAQQGDAASLTGSLPTGPTSKDCYSAMFHAASDCDRLASQMLIPKTGTEEMKNLSQRFREADDASWNALLLYMKSR